MLTILYGTRSVFQRCVTFNDSEPRAKVQKVRAVVGIDSLRWGCVFDSLPPALESKFVLCEKQRHAEAQRKQLDCDCRAKFQKVRAFAFDCIPYRKPDINLSLRLSGQRTQINKAMASAQYNTLSFSINSSINS